MKWAKWEPVIQKEQLRKGELWMSMHRRHAGMVVGDVTFYRKFKLDCHTECVKDEMYAQTLLHVKDPQVINERTQAILAVLVIRFSHHLQDEMNNEQPVNI